MNKKMLYIILIIIITGIGIFIFFQQVGKTWVETNPVQCLSNPWETDWLESHNHSNYPRGDTMTIEQPEIEIIKDYYEKQGIVIFDIRSVINEKLFTCRACSCPQGYTLYLLVSDSDTNKMLELGYKITE